MTTSTTDNTDVTENNGKIFSAYEGIFEKEREAKSNNGIGYQFSIYIIALPSLVYHWDHIKEYLYRNIGTIELNWTF